MSDAQRTVARTQKGRWPGWIWGVPLAAVAIVIWLVVRELSAGGVSVTILLDDAAGAKAGSTKVTYRGITIGKVRKVSLADDHVVMTVRIHDDEAKYLRTGTRFYLEGATMSDPASFKSILAGPTIEMVPGAGAPTRSFVGIAGAAPERLAAAVPFRVHFTGVGGDLKAGAAVTLAGFKVGEVTRVELGVDPDAGSITTAVQIALDPTRFHVGASEMHAAMRALIDHHLRARLTQSPPLVGARQIELAQVPDPVPASLDLSDGIPEIPTTESSGLDHLMTAAGQFPLEEIGDNLRAITARIKSSAPRLEDSIVHLDSALRQLDRAMPEVAPTLQSVHDTVERLKATAGELDKTVASARGLLGDNPAAPDGSLQPTLLHISEAARAIRVLAEYLDAHPESLIKGRAK